MKLVLMFGSALAAMPILFGCSHDSGADPNDGQFFSQLASAQAKNKGAGPTRGVEKEKAGEKPTPKLAKGNEPKADAPPAAPTN